MKKTGIFLIFYRELDACQHYGANETFQLPDHDFLHGIRNQKACDEMQLTSATWMGKIKSNLHYRNHLFQQNRRAQVSAISVFNFKRNAEAIASNTTQMTSTDCKFLCLSRVAAWHSEIDETQSTSGPFVLEDYSLKCRCSAEKGKQKLSMILRLFIINILMTKFEN